MISPRSYLAAILWLCALTTPRVSRASDDSAAAPVVGGAPPKLVLGAPLEPDVEPPKLEV